MAELEPEPDKPKAPEPRYRPPDEDQETVTWDDGPESLTWDDDAEPPRKGAAETTVEEPEKEPWLTKCRAGTTAGAITGLLAGAGLMVPLAKAIDLGRDWEWAEYVIGFIVVLGAALGGLLAGGVAAGCWPVSSEES